jgi:nitroreductase
MSKEINTDLPIIDLIKKRWSPRAFDSRSVEIEKLNRIFEAARWAPSCFNEQPWRFIIGRKEKGYEHEKILNCLEQANQVWAKDAPVLVIVCSKKTFTHNNKQNNWAVYDTGQSVAFMILQAMQEGIYSHQMAGIHKDKIINDFNIPEDYEPVSAIAFGYLGDKNNLPEDLKELEDREQVRHPLSKLVYIGDWLSRKSSIFD